MAISAFANASGGRLILDVRDLKTQPPSYRVDRIDSSNLSAEQLQQIIGGNVSPRITTEIKEITVGENLVKSVYVVSVPEGDAGKVYQSIPDKKFYRRYNDECLAMLEPEIREPLFARPALDLCLPSDAHESDFLIYWTAQAPHMAPQFGAVSLRLSDIILALADVPDFKVEFPAHAIGDG